jgi:PAS domain S-box-containing protein
MNLFRNRGLLTQMILIIAVILLTFFVLSIFAAYRQQEAFIIEEAVEKSRIIAFEAIRTREYLSARLLEGNVQLSEERYGLIPVVASNRIGEQVGRDLGYQIRQVSERYRNPRNAPDSFESSILKKFYADPALKEDFAITRLGEESVFRYLQAFSADRSCLECHGDPATAPDYIKRLFPEETDQAYHYQIGEVIGAASVTIPMDALYRRVYANMRSEVLITGGIFLALITCLGLLTRVAVTRPLARLGEVISDIMRTGRFEEKIPPRGRDEIGTLISGFNEMIDNLRENTAHLEASERRLRTLTETAHDAIVSFLSNGQIILFNRQAEKIFGYSKMEVLGETVDRFIHEECRSKFEDGLESYLRNHGEQLMVTITRVAGRRRDGRKVLLDLSLSVAESDGHPFYTAILREHS